MVHKWIFSIFTALGVLDNHWRTMIIRIMVPTSSVRCGRGVVCTAIEIRFVLKHPAASIEKSDSISSFATRCIALLKRMLKKNNILQNCHFSAGRAFMVDKMECYNVGGCSRLSRIKASGAIHSADIHSEVCLFGMQLSGHLKSCARARAKIYCTRT